MIVFLIITRLQIKLPSPFHGEGPGGEEKKGGEKEKFGTFPPISLHLQYKLNQQKGAATAPFSI